MNPKPLLASLRAAWDAGKAPSPDEALAPQQLAELAEARAAARALARAHYENFSVLSRLVPADLVDDFAAVYAFCRWADDLADETGANESARSRSLNLLAWWRERTRACFSFAQGDAGAEAPRHPVFVALAETARTRGLKPAPFYDLIGAFEQDQRVARYATWAQLLEYCRGSANPVGRIVLALAGHNGERPGDAERFAKSDATCTALQLTNFWQDVRRDLAARDRVYMPSAETGLSAETLRQWLARPNDPTARVAFIMALRPLVERTQRLFDEGADLHRMLEPRIAPVVWLFGAGGRAVARAVERVGCATLWTRPALSRRAKAALVGRAWLMSRLPRRPGSAAADQPPRATSAPSEQGATGAAA